MKNKLISMVAYLPEHPYSKLLSQPLTLGMFVPCDEEGNVYESYKTYQKGNNTICEPYEGLFEISANKKCSGWKYLNEIQEHKEDQRYYDSISYEIALKEYQKAKERVLFEGFEKSEISHIKNLIDNKVLKTAEDLLIYDFITLTATAIKQLNK